MTEPTLNLLTWLIDVKGLSRTRTSGDGPQTADDRLYLNRSQAYEVESVMGEVLKSLNMPHNRLTFGVMYTHLTDYQQGKKVKREDMIEHLKSVY